MSAPITEAELEALRACQSSKQWGAACDAIKEARGGAYPPDWWAKVKLSGLMDEVCGRFGSSSEPTIVPIRDIEELRRVFRDDA